MISKSNIIEFKVNEKNYIFRIHSKSRKNHKVLFDVLNDLNIRDMEDNLFNSTLEICKMLFRDGEYLQCSNIFKGYYDEVCLEFNNVEKTELYPVLDIMHLSIDIYKDRIEFILGFKSGKAKRYSMSLNELLKYQTITTSIYGYFRKEI